MKTKKSLRIQSLLLFGLSLFLLFSCSSDDDNTIETVPDSEFPTLSQEEKEAELVKKLAVIVYNSGLDFPNFNENNDTSKQTFDNGFNTHLNDIYAYTETMTDAEGIPKVRLWLGPEGHIVPTPTWQQNNSNYCGENQEMIPPRKMLEFKVFYDPDFGDANPEQFAYGVQLNLTDIETGVTEKSVYIDPVLDNPENWIADTMAEAWNEMLSQTTIKGAVGPCVETDDNQGYAEFVVSGAVEGSYSGKANFLKNEPVNTWMLFISSENGDVLTELNLQHGLIVFEEEASRPEPGTYTISCQVEGVGTYTGNFTPTFGEEEGYTSAYMAILPGANCQTPDPGTLTIESSTSEKVIGSFHFTAYYYKIEDATDPFPPILGEVEITGEFAAPPF